MHPCDKYKKIKKTPRNKKLKKLTNIKCIYLKSLAFVLYYALPFSSSLSEVRRCDATQINLAKSESPKMSGSLGDNPVPWTRNEGIDIKVRSIILQTKPPIWNFFYTQSNEENIKYTYCKHKFIEFKNCTWRMRNPTLLALFNCLSFVCSSLKSY